jgi:hypothetical protein
MTATISAQSALFSLSDVALPHKSENTLAEKAMLCRLSIGHWEGYKYDRQVSEEIADLHNADKDSVRCRKRLLPRKALREVTQAIGEARRKHAFFTLPWEDDDYRLLPSAAYFDHLQAMKELRANFFAAASRLEARFEQLVIDHSGLGTMLKVEDYPGMRNEGGTLRFLFPNELREWFSFETRVKPVRDAEDFRASIGDQERERIRRQIADSVSAALRLGTREVWQRLYEPVSHMAKCMAEFNSAEKDNKPKLYDSMITNIVKMLDVLPKLNLDGDSSLEKMAEEIRSELIVERKELRKSVALSMQTAEKAAEFARRMEDYMGLPANPQGAIS